MSYQMKADTDISNLLIKTGHEEVANCILNEALRQFDTVELIASENFPSDAVRAATASCFTAKYCEGYPAKRVSGKTGRYYGGCQHADELEEYCKANETTINGLVNDLLQDKLGLSTEEWKRRVDTQP